MRALLGICTILTVGLIAAHIIGCGDVTTEPESEDSGIVDDIVVTDEDKPPVSTDGKPVTVTDETFDTVVLDAELPVVLALGAEW